MIGWQPTRREFLTTTAGVTAGLAALAPASAAHAAMQNVRVRRSIGSLDMNNPDDKKILDQYTQGVGVLLQRSNAATNDQRGWMVQAGLHTYRCQHGNWWFFPWHRAYLYYFERLIQDAVGDPTFALPYWDWTDPNQLVLPAAFRDPNSLLYDARRRPEVNDGTSQLDWSYYDAYFGGILNFVVTRAGFIPSFGSSQASTFAGLERTHGTEYNHGDVEGGPHDTVHGWAGGGGQPDMGNPVYAALDPIFWLHHCNIDRLWSRWRAADWNQHSNPASATWQNQQFEFLRPDEQPELISVSQVVNSWAAPLGYRYDDETSPPPQPPPVPLAMLPMETPMNLRQPEPATLAAAEPRFEVAAQPLTLAIKLPAPAHASMMRALTARPAAIPEAQSRVLLVVEGITFEDKASGTVEVYLNAPEVQPGARPAKEHAVGTFSFFAGHAPPPPGAAAGGMPGHAAAPMTPTFSRAFDITDTVRALQAAGKWNPDQLHVSLVRRSFDKGKPVAGKVTFARASLRVTPAP